MLLILTIIVLIIFPEILAIALGIIALPFLFIAALFMDKE